MTYVFYTQVYALVFLTGYIFLIKGQSVVAKGLRLACYGSLLCLIISILDQTGGLLGR